jgi:uncharacterized protein
MQKILFFSEYLTKRYGHPLYRIPLDLALSCPNRVQNSGRGCIFCAEDGARARHLRHNLNLPEQVASGIEYVQRRYQAKAPYIAYFQSYTNTYADVAKLRELYLEALACTDFACVIIATRPDCLPVPVLDLLTELNEKYDLWVELGVQTAHNHTLELIGRGHDFQSVTTAVKALSERNIKTAAHVILGLPGETTEDFNHTAKMLSALPFSGVKLHNLLILKGTELAREYAANPSFVHPMNEYEYAEASAAFLKKLPDDWVTMRVTADAPPEKIIAPKWWMKKGQFIDLLKSFMDNDSNVRGVTTEDGSQTLYQPEYRQYFHTLAGAATEAESKFLEPSKLKNILEKTQQAKVLDIGFGLGYNAFAALAAARKTGGHVEITSCEKDPSAIINAAMLFPLDSVENRILKTLVADGYWQEEHGSIKLLIGDARGQISELQDSFDTIFLDGFSPDKNPELWTYDFILQLKSLLDPAGILVTYSAAYPVRGALFRAGFEVGESTPFGRRRGGTTACLPPRQPEIPLAEKETNIILKSTVGTPYRDIGLNSSRKSIIKTHAALVARLRKSGVPRWFKKK